MSGASNDLKVFVAGAVLVIIAAITSVGYYNVNDRVLLSKNIDTAIAKGMDPLSVRCSYAHSGDTICIAYAASQKR